MKLLKNIISPEEQEPDPRLIELLEESERIQKHRQAATEDFGKAIKEHVEKGRVVPFRRAK